MEEQLILLETAKLANKKGYKLNINPLNTTYDLGDDQLTVSKMNTLLALKEGVHYIAAPTQSLLQKWLREEHDLEVLVVKSDNNSYDSYVWGETRELFFPESVAKSYEEALERGLLEALKLIHG